MKQLRMAVTGAVLALALTAQAASADWLLTPFIGATFGGDTNDTQLVYGGTIAYMGARVVGFEVDVGYSPDFFGAEADDDFDLVGDNNVTTLMANVIVGVPLGETTGARVYASGGAGLLRTRVASADDFFDVTDNSFGVNVGGGVYAFPGENVGLRADVRYFRSVDDSGPGDDIDLDLGGFNFWRGTVGITFRF